ncbi:ABC transporter ATP-binding protein [Dactylosporangium sp. NPDC049140]|uniref:ABC transporter ATP-binding protein n=1 Tax=Dactylosporangium sp. NPDC049140 TaxID=3155647 RepID=UPI0033FDA632
MTVLRASLRDRLDLLSGFFRSGRGWFAGLAGCLVLQSAVPTGIALTWGQLVAHAATAAAWVWLALFGAAYLVGHAVEAAIGALTYRAKARIDGRFRHRLATLLAGGMDLATLEQPGTQDLVRLASTDPRSWTEKTVGDGMVAQLALIGQYLSTAMLCAVLAGYAWWAPLVVLAAAVACRLLRIHRLLAALRLWSGGITDGRRAEYWKKAVTSASEGKEVRIFGYTDFVVGTIRRSVFAMFAPVWRNLHKGFFGQSLIFFLAAVPMAALYLAAAADVIHGRIAAGLQVAVMASVFGIYTSLGTVVDSVEIAGAMPAVRAWQALRRLPAGPPARAESAPVAARPPTIRLVGVGFGYPAAGRRVLDGLDLEIRSGELLALVGLNGAGKSTLVKLLARLYRPDAGRIEADGVALDALDPERWRGLLAFAFTDFVRYHLSVADNIRLGRPDGPLDEPALRHALSVSGFDEVLSRLPEGLDTVLGTDRTGGVELSGGQWQQLALARALYRIRRGAQILVLDEPTANLDVRTEREFFTRINAAGGNFTRVLISHRLSTVRHADRIAVLDSGRITECGTHAELMALGGRYCTMFNTQSRRYVAAGVEP